MHDKGFAILPDFLGVERLVQMRVGLEPIFALTGNRIVDGTKRGWPGTQTIHIPNLYAKTRAIDEVSLILCFYLLLKECQAFQMSVAVAMCPGPGCDRQGLHQDDSH